MRHPRFLGVSRRTVELALCAICAACAEAAGVKTETYVSYSDVLTALQRDEQACKAIEVSRRSIQDFRSAFERREIRHVDFMVTVMCRADDALIPVGILVDHFS